MTLAGDPDVGPVSVSSLLESSYLTARAALLQDGVALTDPIPKAFRPGFSRPDCRQVEHAPTPSTSQISIVDGSGNALAMTTTLNVNFGSWITLGGFFLNDAMTNFAIPADGGCPANFPSGDKRPETSMAPVIGMDTNGNLTLVCGSAGAGEIVDYVAQAVVEILAGRPPAAALDDGHVSTAKASYPESVGIVELEQGRAIAQLGSYTAVRLRHSCGHLDTKFGLFHYKAGSLFWFESRVMGRDSRSPARWNIRIISLRHAKASGAGPPRASDGFFHDPAPT